ncbi:MAG: hypothetical protein IJR90_01705 [Clostridia bacterium]|nr:hypothetical protein [Clostridia bacterium]
MTYNELNGIYYIKKEIERDRARIRELRERAESTVGSGTGMWGPHAGVVDRVGCCVAAMVDLERAVDANLWRLYRKEAEVTAFIDSVADPRLRAILKLRFIDCLSWRAVAQRLGAGETENGALKAVRRFLREAGVE